MKIILFWSNLLSEADTSVIEWQNSTVQLSPFHYLSLLSHVKYGNKVDLYTYNKAEASNIPKGITVKDANDIFPIEFAHNSLLRGHSIAHISDAIRLKVASKENAIPLDLDAVVLNDFPKDQNSGWFATAPAKVTGGFAFKWGKNHPPLPVHDKSWDGKGVTMFPIKVNDKMSQYTYDLANKIFKTLAYKPSKDSKAWNYVMWELRSIMNVDKKFVIHKPMAFCPITGWLSSGNCYSLEYPTRLDGKTSAFGYTFPSIDSILQNSITVQHFFESVYSFTKKPQLKNTFWLDVKKGSLVSNEAEHVVGSNWRQELYEYSN
tara:strand:+ start:14324 stop:15280 length:957 start_codon:yes stop_codon:yes gene_type:complete